MKWCPQGLEKRLYNELVTLKQIGKKRFSFVVEWSYQANA
jgi:hypothetical protein